jgi:hypothetical protein
MTALHEGLQQGRRGQGERQTLLVQAAADDAGKPHAAEV